LKYYFEFEASPLEIGKISEMQKTFQKPKKWIDSFFIGLTAGGCDCENSTAIHFEFETSIFWLFKFVKY
jgi:hypothetical protein